MKKKMAIVLSAILACSMGMTAMAAPSPSIVKEPVAQVVVSPSVGTSNTVTTQAAVSYTHLDVYKRQHIVRLPCPYSQSRYR